MNLLGGGGAEARGGSTALSWISGARYVHPMSGTNVVSILIWNERTMLLAVRSRGLRPNAPRRKNSRIRCSG
jgi:hypothetical protein